MSDLPSLDVPQAYVVVGPDDQRGPYTLELLIAEVVAGRLHDATPVWWPGLADWTTMTGHPGLGAEIQRRRSPAAPASAFPAPAPPPPAPAAPQAQPEPAQHQQAAGQYSPATGGYAAAAAPGQDYSTDMYAGYGAAAQPSVEASPPEEPMGAVSPVAEPVQPPGEPAEAQESTELVGEVVAAEVTGGDESEMHPAPGTEAEVVVSDTGVVMEVEPVELTADDYAALDEPQPEEGFRAAGEAMGLDPVHGAAFADLITRSRVRAEAAAALAAVDEAFVSAMVAAATAQGLTEVGRQEEADAHVVSFRSGNGDTWRTSIGKVTGTMVGSREGEVPLDASCTSTSYGGGAVGSTGEHGEILISTGEWGGASTARVSLLLPLADYLGEDRSVDTAALDRDLQAVIATVRDRLR